MSTKPQSVDFLALLSLSIMWSSSFLFIKFAVDTLPPQSVAAGRILIAAVVLYLVMRIRGAELPRDRRSWLFFIAVGIVGNVLPFNMISWAQLTTPSSVASILIGTAPLIGFVLGHLLTEDEKLTPDRVFGVLVGFIGLIVLIGPEAILQLGTNAVSQLAIVAGATCYVTAGFITRAMPPMDSFARAAGVLLVASIIAVPIAIYVDEPWTLTPSMESLGALVVLGIFPTAIATMVLYFVIMRVGATFVALNNYLNPVLGVLWGVLFAAEIPTSQTYMGLGLILAGMIFTQLKLSHLIIRPQS
ncbi:DMT family transporter [Sneathiella limimaris]|uniref:DMT family transporter n=1 Tax=Sneathiella limimaris TaxID=1964213 RepID=UPI00146C33A3|nr:EamA family transporter [Sneathiella limimaris]